MLDLLYLLVKYGYYDDLEDINVLIIPLVSLLNGKNDKPFPEANNEQSDPYRMVRGESIIKCSTVEFITIKYEEDAMVYRQTHCSNDIIVTNRLMC